MNVDIIHKQKPAIGIDIGHSSVKAVQLKTAHHQRNHYDVVGYGIANFPARSFADNGVLEEPDLVAKAINQLLTETIVGGVTSDRIITSVPVSHTFSRVVALPQLDHKELEAAVQLEIEQYVPVPEADLYVDYEVGAVQDDNKVEVLIVAAPKLLIDSYMQLFEMVDLEVGLIETSTTASVRTLSIAKSETDEQNAIILIDFGARSSDLSVFDSTIRVTGTVDKGGDTFTEDIAKQMSITHRKASTIKTHYGLKDSKHQSAILAALKPSLSQLNREVQRMNRYYKNRSKTQEGVDKLVVLGGGSNMPGFIDYLEDVTGIPTESANSWRNISFKKLQEPHHLESTLYTTAIGSAVKGVRPL